MNRSTFIFCDASVITLRPSPGGSGRHVDGNDHLYPKRSLNFIVLGAAFAFGSAGAAVDSTRSPAGLEGVPFQILAFASLRCAFRSDTAIARSMRYSPSMTRRTATGNRQGS